MSNILPLGTDDATGRTKTWEPGDTLADIDVSGAATTEFKKLTTATTWTAISGLSGEAIANVKLDARLLTGGHVDVFVDGTTPGFAVFSAGKSEVTIVAAKTGYSDNREAESALLMPNIILNPSSSLSIIAKNQVGDIDGAGSQQTSSGTVISANVTVPRGLCVLPDGNDMYVMDSNDDDLSRFSMGTAFTISSSFAYVEKLNTTSENSTMVSVRFKADGMRFWTLGKNGNDTIYEYNCSTAKQIVDATYSGYSYDVTALHSDIVGFEPSPDGQYMFLLSSTEDFFRIKLNTANTLADGVTTDASQTFDTGSGTNMLDITLSSTGRKLFCLEPSTGSSDNINQISLPIPHSCVRFYNPSLKTNVNATDIDPKGIFLVSSGTNHYMYWTGNTNKKVYRLTVADEPFAGTVLASVNYGTPS